MATLDIEWRHLEVAGSTCERCDDTGKALKAVLAQLSSELASQGHEVRLRETPLGPASLAESNLILLNGRPLDDWLGARTTETGCASCGDLVGESVCCRAVEIDGTLHEAIPEALIRSAALAAIHKETPPRNPPP